MSDGMERALPEVSRMELRPDDIIVFTVPHRISIAEKEEIGAQLQQRFTNPVLMVEGGTLSVLSPTATRCTAYGCTCPCHPEGHA